MTPSPTTPDGSARSELLGRFRSRDRRALARLLTLAQEGLADEVLETLDPALGKARILGITGSPGVGKSTLVGALARKIREQAFTVGIVAIDPSSPFTGGALLGDRIRMLDLDLDPGVFIRSMGSRGAHGGLARHVLDLIHLLDAFGLDRILVETVGVGQGEVRIGGVADSTVVVTMPDQGDGIQMIKAGLLEIADVYVVNKADREGADRSLAGLQEMLALREETGGWHAPVLGTVALRGTGVPELLRALEDHWEQLDATGELARRRARRREIELETLLEDELRRRFVAATRDGGTAARILEAVRDGRRSVRAAVRDLFAELG